VCVCVYVFYPAPSKRWAPSTVFQNRKDILNTALLTNAHIQKLTMGVYNKNHIQLLGKNTNE